MEDVVFSFPLRVRLTIYTYNFPKLLLASELFMWVTVGAVAFGRNQLPDVFS